MSSADNVDVVFVAGTQSAAQALAQQANLPADFSQQAIAVEAADEALVASARLVILHLDEAVLDRLDGIETAARSGTAGDACVYADPEVITGLSGASLRRWQRQLKDKIANALAPSEPAPELPVPEPETNKPATGIESASAAPAAMAVASAPDSATEASTVSPSLPPDLGFDETLDDAFDAEVLTDDPLAEFGLDASLLVDEEEGAADEPSADLAFDDEHAGKLDDATSTAAELPELAVDNTEDAGSINERIDEPRVELGLDSEPDAPASFVDVEAKQGERNGDDALDSDLLREFDDILSQSEALVGDEQPFDEAPADTDVAAEIDFEALGVADDLDADGDAPKARPAADSTAPNAAPATAVAPPADEVDADDAGNYAAGMTLDDLELVFDDDEQTASADADDGTKGPAISPSVADDLASTLALLPMEDEDEDKSSGAEPQVAAQDESLEQRADNPPTTGTAADVAAFDPDDVASTLSLLPIDDDAPEGEATDVSAPEPEVDAAVDATADDSSLTLEPLVADELLAADDMLDEVAFGDQAVDDQALEDLPELALEDDVLEELSWDDDLLDGEDIADIDEALEDMDLDFDTDDTKPPTVTTQLPAEPAIGTPAPADRSLPPLWILGASIGGPEAIREFAGGLPANFGGTLLLVQHIGDRFTEALINQLQRASKLTVQELRDGANLAAGVINVMPADRVISVSTTGVVALRQRTRDAAYSPCIDDVVHDTLAGWPGESNIIIFSGMASDGVEAAKAVAARGGECWAQTTESCVVSSMVDGVKRAGIVGFSGTPAELAQALAAHVDTVLDSATQVQQS